MIVSTDGSPLMGNKKKLDFKNYIPPNSEISLSEITFRYHSNNLKSDRSIEFNLTILGFFEKIHLPVIKIHIEKNYFPDIYHFIKAVRYYLDKKIHYFPEKKYYHHFLSRFTAHNDVFILSPNDGDLRYEMGLSFDDSIKSFLNIPRNVFYITKQGFKNSKIINFQQKNIFPLICLQIDEEVSLRGNKFLREIQSVGDYGVLQHMEFDDPEWRRLSNFSCKSLNLDWSNDCTIVNYVIRVREYY